jgi:hypothetical protein
MEPEGSLPCSQEPTLVPIMSQLNPFPTMQLYILTVHPNIDIPSMSKSSEWSFPFRLPKQNLFLRIYLPQARHMPPTISSFLISSS